MNNASKVRVDDSGSGSDVKLRREATVGRDLSVGARGDGDRELGVNEGFALGGDCLCFSAIEVISCGLG